MIRIVRLEKDNPEIQRVIEKYGVGFDVIYFDGKADEKIAIARNFLKDGFDEEVISRNTGLSIDYVKKLKRKL